MFVSLFRSFAAANPVKAAVVCRSGTICYGEMALQVRRVSKYLSLMGVEQGSRVAMALPGSIRTLVLYHALADSGAVIIPLSRELSLDAASECLEDARPQFCLVSAELALFYQQLCAGPGPCQVVSERTRPYSLEEMFHRDPACIRPLPRIMPDDELLIHYHRDQGHWSGLVQTHRNHIQRLLDWSRTAGLGSSDSTLCIGSMSDPFVTETLALTALATGQTLYLMEEGEASAKGVIRLIRQKEVSIMGAHPAFYRQLLDIPQPGCVRARHEAVPEVGQKLSHKLSHESCRELQSLRLALCDAGSLKDGLSPALHGCHGVRLNHVFSLPGAALAMVDCASSEYSEYTAIGSPIEGVEACVQGLGPYQDGVGELWLRSEHFAERTTRNQPLYNAWGWLATGVLVRRQKGRFYFPGEEPAGVGEHSGVYLSA